MKNYNINLVFIAIALLSIGSYKKKTVTPDTPTELELQLEALMNNNSSWGLTNGSVIKDGYDVTSQFSGFTLNIGEFTYTTSNGLDTAWPSSGNWEFSNNNPNKVLRSDGVLIDVTLTNGQLTLSFTVANLGGKTSGINGNYEFTLTSN
jgi:hypothetical protein